MAQKTTKKKSTTRRRKRKTSFWRRLLSATNHKALYIGVAVVLVVYAFFFYRYVVSPYAQRWQAIYGDVIFPEGCNIHGLDVSHHQGKINWKELSRNDIAGEPITFVFIKATEGTTLLDENFNDNFYKARESGFIRGAYHYLSTTSPAAAQAEYFLKQVHLEDGDLPPVLDVEEIGELTPSELRKATLTWLRRVEQEYGVKPILYTSHKFKLDYLNTPEFDEYPYWIAHYYIKQLNYKGEWKFWQHTDRGRLKGINGDVDLNVYNGSQYDMQQLTLRTEDEGL